VNLFIRLAYPPTTEATGALERGMSYPNYPDLLLRMFRKHTENVRQLLSAVNRENMNITLVGLGGRGRDNQKIRLCIQATLLVARIQIAE